MGQVYVKSHRRGNSLIRAYRKNVENKRLSSGFAMSAVQGSVYKKALSNLATLTASVEKKFSKGRNKSTFRMFQVKLLNRASKASRY